MTIRPPYAPSGTGVSYRGLVAVDNAIIGLISRSGGASGVISSSYSEAGSGIVEQGEGDDGKYIIFSSGIQICWIVQSITSATSGNGTADFPKAFGSTPQALGVNRYRSSSSASFINSNDVTGAVRATTASQYLWALSGSSTSYTYVLEASFMGMKE